MAVLHNRVSNEELKKRMYEENIPRTTVSFYQYLPIAEPQQFRDQLYIDLTKLQVFGRIYIAREGINAQISVPENQFDAFKAYIHGIQGLEGLRLNVAVTDDGKSFWVLRIKVREKIVADGIHDPNFNMEHKGKYVDASAFNTLTDDPATLVIDMRNHYEYEVGHFDRAIEVPSDTFREQLPMAVSMLESDKEKNIIMYCTGGIRCEKASAYLLHQGFKNVFHLEGGIINYVNKVKEQGLVNKFRGKNFVFDERLGEAVSDDIIANCHQCGNPADTHTNCNNEGCHLLFIQCDSCKEKYQGCCSEECTSVLSLHPEERKALRKGIKNGAMIFNKSRQGKYNLKQERQ